MTQIEVKVLVDLADPRQIQALNELFATLEECQQLQKNVQSTKQTKPKANSQKAKDVPETSADEIKIEDVRALLAKKVESHRSEIKSKLTELGAPNVTALAKENYAEFVVFLNNLR